MSALHAKKEDVRPAKKEKILNVGALLRKARLEQKHRLPHVVKMLNIKEDYIKALEAEDQKALPQNAIYTLGFLRAYAQFLGLNAVDIVEAFKKKHNVEIMRQAPTLIQEEDEMPEAKEESPKKPSSFSMQWSIIALGVFIGALYIKDLETFDHFFVQITNYFLSFLE
jgi:cytoskeletal protein RodZ